MRRMESMIIPMLLAPATVSVRAGRWHTSRETGSFVHCGEVLDVNQDEVYTALMKYLDETYLCSLNWSFAARPLVVESLYALESHFVQDRGLNRSMDSGALNRCHTWTRNNFVYGI
jgi:hypothetical protein